MLRFLVTLVLGLHLFSDQCHGFAEEALRELCRKLPNSDSSPANNGSSMAPSESATFSCGFCSPGTSRSNPYVCSYCYEGTQGSERKAFFGISSLRTYSQIGIREAFSCQGCKFGLIQKPVICDDCKTKTDHASQESATGCCCYNEKGRATNRSILQFCLSFRHQWVYLSSVKSFEAIKCGGIQW